MARSNDGEEGSERLTVLASACDPLSSIERSFVAAVSALSVPDPASVERNHASYLVFRWDAPAADLGSLWVSITPAEVVLSTRISHCHFDDGSEHQMADAGAREAARVLRGEVCNTISYNPSGQQHSNGWGPTDKLSETLAYSRKVFGDGITTRAWNWFGEVIP